MFKIIQKAPINHETEKCFSLLIMNNFYENILSSNYIESELLALIERSLNYEINNLNSINDYNKFLTPSATGFLLGGLISKNDVKSYFQMILKGIFEKLENKNKKWDFQVTSIAQYVLKRKELMMKERKKNPQNKNSLNYESSFDYNNYGRSKKEREEEDNFFLGTYTPDLRIKDLISKQENLNEDMKAYIQKQINEGKNNENIYSTSNFLSQVYSSSDEASEVLSYYQKDFMSCIEIIKDIFNILNQNMHLVPFSIKCICRIISILIKRKFPNISKVELNAFIGQFFFQNLFTPICGKPDYNALITSFIISKQTRNNIHYTCSIIKQLISGKFYTADKDPSYTPFNWFFILDSMPLAFEFFDKIINVTLPPYIEKIINTEDDNYYYNFFEENKDEFAFQKSICFSIQDFNCLFNIAKDNKDFFIQEPNVNGLSEEIAKKRKNERRLFGLTIDKLSMKIHQEKIKLHLEKEKSEKIINFFLKSDTSYDEKFTQLLKIKQKKTSPSINIPELKELNSEEDIQKNNLIKIQNCLSTLLFNYRILNKSDFSEGTTENTISILNEILKFLKTGSFVLDNTIPTDWYVHTLLKLLKSVPEEYKENDFELIYKNLTDELNKSIKSLDFAELSRIFERLKYTERAFKNINLNLLAINEIETNNIIKNFAENHKLEVEIKWNLSNKKFEILRCNYGNDENQLLGEFFFEDNAIKNKKKPNVFKTIFEFTNKFPPLVYFQQKQGYDLFELEEEFKLPDQLEIYFKFVKEEMKKNKLFSHLKNDPKGFQNIYYNITSYIMDKLYDKIFPSEPDSDDLIIYQNSVRLSWIEPRNLIKNNNYNFDNFLPETKELILNIDREKAPLKKIRCLTEVANKISNIIAFNNGDDFVGVDDTLPIFQFAVIKAQPYKFSSNYKFMNMFLNKELRSGPQDHLISQMNVIGEFIKEISYDKLSDVTKEIFVRKCNEATNNDLSH